MSGSKSMKANRLATYVTTVEGIPKTNGLDICGVASNEVPTSGSFSKLKRTLWHLPISLALLSHGAGSLELRRRLVCPT